MPDDGRGAGAAANDDEGVCSNDYADTCLEDDDCDGEENKCVAALSATALCHCMMDLPAEERYELLFRMKGKPLPNTAQRLNQWCYVGPDNAR